MFFFYGFVFRTSFATDCTEVSLRDKQLSYFARSILVSSSTSC